MTIWRDNTLGRLIANGNEYSGSSPSGYIALNTDNNPLYVGGVSQGSSVSSLYKDRTKVCTIMPGNTCTCNSTP